MSKKTSNDGSLQTTKQMLDELDALMEKMLSLPANDLESSRLPEPPPLPSIMSAKLTVMEPPPIPSKAPRPTYPTFNEALFEIAREESAQHPPLNAPHLSRPTAEPRRSRTPDLVPPLPAPEPLTNDIAPPNSLPELEPLLSEIAAPASPPTRGLSLTPLVWINQRFDGATTWVPGGARLRSEGGRMVLGLSGVMMTLVAVAWLLKDWLGWN